MKKRKGNAGRKVEIGKVAEERVGGGKVWKESGQVSKGRLRGNEEYMDQGRQGRNLL